MSPHRPQYSLHPPSPQEDPLHDSSHQSSLPDTDAAYVVLGAGVIGLTTALELKARKPLSHVIIVAKHLPGDLSLEYTSPWAGANWLSVATDSGRQESWDEVTYMKFGYLADNVPEADVTRMPIRAIFDNEPKNAGVLSQGTGKIWYDKLTGGIRDVANSELPQESNFGFEIDTFIVNVTSYLPWYVSFAPVPPHTKLCSRSSRLHPSRERQ